MDHGREGVGIDWFLQPSGVNGRHDATYLARKSTIAKEKHDNVRSELTEQGQTLALGVRGTHEVALHPQSIGQQIGRLGI